MFLKFQKTTTYQHLIPSHIPTKIFEKYKGKQILELNTNFPAWSPINNYNNDITSFTDM